MIWLDSHNIFASWRNHFSHLLNVHGVNDVRQTRIYTAEPLGPHPRAFEVVLATQKLKNRKSPGIDQMPAELIKALGRTVHYNIHKRIIAIRNKEDLSEAWKESIIVLSIRRAIKEIEVITETNDFCQPRTKFYPTSCCQG